MKLSVTSRTAEESAPQAACEAPQSTKQPRKRRARTGGPASKYSGRVEFSHHATFKHGYSYTPEYRAWQTMRLRCQNPANQAYANYGGRGIIVCERWRESVSNFIADMGPKPTPKHEIDRINNDGNYEPGNCRWVTRTENDRNRRSNRWLTFRGETLTLTEWAQRFGIRNDTLTHRIEIGWDVERALTTPVRPKSPNGQAIQRVPRVRVTKLTAAMVIEIRERGATGEAHGSLAKAFGVTRRTIGKVIQHKLWRAV